MKGKGRKLLMAGLAIVFLISSALLVRNFLDYGAGEDAYADAAAIAKNTEETLPKPTNSVEFVTAQTEAPPEQVQTAWVVAEITEEDPVLEELKQLDLAALREVNPDVIGWIRIPNTKIDYPILQGQDNDFYLNHNWKGDGTIMGSIFLEWQNSADLTDFNTIIYGHNMANGTMFSDLHRYGYKSYSGDSPYVYILSDAGVYRYEVFSTYDAPVESQTYGLSFHQMQTRAEFLIMALENSLLETDVVPQLNDRILTLSTCSGMGYSARRVVHARLKMVEVAVNQ